MDEQKGIHRQPPPPPAPHMRPPEPPIPPQPKLKKPFYKKWWFWLLFILIALYAIGTNDQESQNNSPSVPDETTCTDHTFAVSNGADGSLVLVDAEGKTLESGTIASNNRYETKRPLVAETDYTVKVTKQGFEPLEQVVTGYDDICSTSLSLMKAEQEVKEEPKEEVEEIEVKEETVQPVQQEEPKPEPERVETPQPATDDVPREYKNALRAAKQYDDLIPMSKRGMFEQLSSEYGDQYPEDAAQYAIEHVGADWKANALRAAEQYMEMMPMSQQGLYDQLVSEYGDQYTAEEAQYAIDQLDW